MKTIKEALWEIVRDENIIITNQNIDWLLDRASKKATGDAQALKESILERKRVIEENIPCALTNEEKVSEKLLINEDKSNNFDVKSNNSTQNQLTNSKLQIEEMCRLICNACEFGCGFDGECDGGYDYKKCNNAIETALALYNAGYRKQSEGEWIKPSRYSQHICTICRKNPCQYFGMLPPFCPNCGSKMKGGE